MFRWHRCIRPIGIEFIAEVRYVVKLPIGFLLAVDFHKLLVGELADTLFNALLLAVFFLIGIVNNSYYHSVALFYLKFYFSR